MRYLLTLVLCVRLSAAIALVNTAACAGGVNSVTTSAVSMTGATLVVVGCASVGASNLCTITSNPSNTWQSGTAYSATGAAIQIFYVINPTVSGTMTFTATITAGLPSICAFGFSGTATSGTIDKQNGLANSSFDSTIQPGNVTPSVNNEVLVSDISFTSTNTISINSSFTGLVQLNYSGGVNRGIAMAYLIQTTATLVNPTWTLSSGSTGTGASIGTWQPAAAVGGCTTGLLLIGAGTC